MAPKYSGKSLAQAEIAEQVAAFLQQGGAVDQIPRGRSGLNPLQPAMPEPFGVSVEGERPSRTPVPEVINALAARRRPTPPVTTSRVSRPRRKVIYDDFGEPLRYVWEND